MSVGPDATRTALVVVLAVTGGMVAGVAPAGASSVDGFVYLTTSTSPGQPTAGEEFTFTTTFHSADASDDPVEVQRITVLDDEDAVLAEKRFQGTANPSVPAGGQLARNFSLEFDDPGTHELSVRVTFESAAGRRSVVTFDATVSVYDPHPRLEVNAAPAAPGERTTLNVTVANGLEGDVRDVELALAAADVDLDESSRVASRIPGGTTRAFRFSATPETLGLHDLEATLAYTTADGDRRTLTRTLTVRFREPDLDGDLGLAVDVAPAMRGAVTTLNLTVANGFDRPLRQLEVDVAAEGVTIRGNRRVATGFASGAERTFRFEVNRSVTGPQPVEVTVTYTTADGVEGRVSETLSTTFQGPENPGKVRLTGVDAVARGGQLEVSATASNVGTSDVSAVVVSLPDDGPVAPTDYFVGGVEASDFASFTLTTAVDGNVSSVPLTVTYVVDGVERSYTRTVPVESIAASPPAGAGGGGPPLTLVGGVIALVVVAGLVIWRWR